MGMMWCRGGLWRCDVTFDLSKLKPGDEVGIEFTRNDRIDRAVAIVAVIHDDGVIELEGQDYFDREGNCAFHRTRRLAAPTDEGRLAMLQETIYEDLCSLQEKARSLPLGRLKEFRAAVLELLANP
jgi:hypothetical protein